MYYSFIHAIYKIQKPILFNFPYRKRLHSIKGSDKIRHRFHYKCKIWIITERTNSLSAYTCLLVYFMHNLKYSLPLSWQLWYLEVWHIHLIWSHIPSLSHQSYYYWSQPIIRGNNSFGKCFTYYECKDMTILH